MEKTMPVYDGDDKFIFLSYCHKDKELVYPLIAEMQRMGYRIWYDQGIAEGSRWLETIAEKLEHCAVFLFCVTPDYAGSNSCSKEFHFAFGRDKPSLGLFLRDTSKHLTPGMRMYLSNIQSVGTPEAPVSRSVAIDAIKNNRDFECCISEVPAAYRLRYLREDHSEHAIMFAEFDEPVSEPSGPEKASSDGYTYIFDRWELVTGVPLREGNRCAGDATFRAVYRCKEDRNGDKAKAPDGGFTSKVDGENMPGELETIYFTPAFLVNIADGHQYKLDQNTLIGSDAKECRVFIPDRSVSHIHARLKDLSYGCFLEQISEKSITFVNGEPIEPHVETEVFDGDIIAFSGVSFRLRSHKHRTYRMRFFDDNEGQTPLETLECKLGDQVWMPDGPRKEADASFHYEFERWEWVSGTPLLDGNRCAGEAAFRAVYRREPREYRLSFLWENGDVFRDIFVKYGDIVPMPAGPEKATDESYTYTFDRWELVGGTPLLDGNRCAGAADFKATYEREKGETLHIEAFLVPLETKTPIAIEKVLQLKRLLGSPKIPKQLNADVADIEISGGYGSYQLRNNNRTQEVVVLRNGERLTLVPGGEATESLYHKDRVLLGDVEFSFRSNSRPPEPLERPKAYLETLKQKIEISHLPFKLGRYYQTQEAWSLYVSRDHAEITFSEGKYYLTINPNQKNKKNTLNAVDMEEGKPYELHDGDVILFATDSWRFGIEK